MAASISFSILRGSVCFPSLPLPLNGCGPVREVFLFWVWISAFLLVVFILMLNFLLAIVVDGYAEVAFSGRGFSDHHGFS